MVLSIKFMFILYGHLFWIFLLMRWCFVYIDHVKGDNIKKTTLSYLNLWLVLGTSNNKLCSKKQHKLFFLFLELEMCFWLLFFQRLTFYRTQENENPLQSVKEDTGTGKTQGAFWVMIKPTFFLYVL